MQTEAYWNAVEQNDANYDGRFVYAVKTTGIYCKPSCRSRLPKKENVAFFNDVQEAEKAGFRACKRCLGMQPHLELINKACTFINRQEAIPSLEHVATHVGMSPNHFQQVFSQALGISPRSYADAGRHDKFKVLLQNGASISGALYEAGFSSTSRVYEFAHRYLGMTPKAYMQGGKAETIWFTVVDCRLDKLLIAATQKGLCSVRLSEDENKLRMELAQEFHAANLIESDTHFRQWTQALVDYLAGNAPWPTLPYDLKATAFQRKVWEWLRTIPAGKTYNYADVAKAIGEPKAARAVARACATNPVALVIPCHRIIPKAGGIGGYRWDPERKKSLLRIEKN
ncbi:MAG: methylated-DNA--[protein]-cysteine S-methyltransferase [Candidatus Latescibacteria bacterium]|nr:methylated-DNA--[protein]-cysteine S-methyltransferase [Candidatus Latescibacterota bacterium]